MQAETLNCPMCGAAASSDAAQCLYCDSRLATVACPSCYGIMFLGSKHCSHCGAEWRRTEKDDAQSCRCPRCRLGMKMVGLGDAALRECPQCAGLWVDVASFEKICADRERQSMVLGAASFVQAHAADTGAERRVRYVPCPECDQLMNRANFARCSGVVVDTCKGHGTWFDRDELRRIVEFIRTGGLEASRAKEKQEIEDDRRRLRQEQLAAVSSGSNPLIRISDNEDQHLSVVHAARGLLKILLD